MSEPEYSVVLIDDDPEFLAGTEMYLSSEGFRVFACAQSRQALQTIRRLEPDAVLLDHDMPEATGLEILERLRGMSLTRDVPVLFLTASRDPELMSRGFHGGLDDYISKPFRGEELALRLRAIIQRRQAAQNTGDDGAALLPPPRAEGRMILLQTVHFAPFQRSGHAALPEHRGIQRRLVHRLRDVLAKSSNEAAAVRRRRDGIVLLFPGEQVFRADRLKRALAAANRLSAVHASDFLAPVSDTDSTLIRFAWPRFRLLDVRLSPGGPRDIPRLLESLTLELEDDEWDYRTVEL